MIAGMQSFLTEIAERKAMMLEKGSSRYVIFLMMFGMYVGSMLLLAFSFVDSLQAIGSPTIYLLMGISFSVALLKGIKLLFSFSLTTLITEVYAKMFPATSFGSGLFISLYTFQG